MDNSTATKRKQEFGGNEDLLSNYTKRRRVDGEAGSSPPAATLSTPEIRPTPASWQELCEVCSNIHFKPLKDCKLPEKAAEDVHFGYGALFYFHHKSYTDLRGSAKNGCPFCIMLWRVLSDPPPYSRPFGPSAFLRSQVFLCIKEYSYRLKNGESYAKIVVESDGFRVEGSLAHMFPATNDKSKSREARYPIIFNDSPALVSSDVDTTTTSAANIALAMSWLANCTECHLPCNGSGSSISAAYPRRVIDVTDPESPKLISRDGVDSQYVALSYKWGSNPRCSTTLANLEERMHLIPKEALPKTFLDAIIITHQLGFQYLWTDALCIIQDSTEDLDTEIQSMDLVYQNAALTIFAAGATDADAGISSTRNPLETRPCQVPVKITQEDGQTSEMTTIVSFYVLDNSAAPKDYAPPGHYPLYERGWVLQEQIMSRRCLIFGSRFISWECLCAQSSETWPTISPRIEDLAVKPGRPDWTLDLFPEMRKRVALWHDNPIKTFDKWYEMVENYSRRNLSYPADVLIALQGLSNALVTLYKFTYAFGLWKEDLPYGLGWLVQGSQSDQTESVSGNEYAQGVPSWSWASCWGRKIDFRTPKLHRIHKYLTLTGVESDSDGRLNEFAENNTLIFNGYTKSARVRPPANKTREDPRNPTYKPGLMTYPVVEKPLWLGLVHDMETDEIVGSIAYDRNPDMVKVSEIVCCLCSLEGWHDDEYVTCLALVPISGSQAKYRRVGLIFLSSEEWFGLERRFYGPVGEGFTTPSYLAPKGESSILFLV